MLRSLACALPSLVWLAHPTDDAIHASVFLFGNSLAAMRCMHSHASTSWLCVCVPSSLDTRVAQVTEASDRIYMMMEVAEGKDLLGFILDNARETQQRFAAGQAARAALESQPAFTQAAASRAKAARHGMAVPSLSQSAPGDSSPLVLVGHDAEAGGAGAGAVADPARPISAPLAGPGAGAGAGAGAVERHRVLVGLPEATARGIFRDVASALVFLHACGTVHRDMKPGVCARFGGA